MIHWNSFADFIAMGGYGFYVWGSFGATVLIMAIEPIVVIRNRKSTIARLKRQLRADTRADHRNTAE
ncbi:MAG: heme exporter protein CcmD [Betaproteobacteria bacterium]|jgi:heme exporter protein D|nr:heme exporter protein CcmD [Betaproteobacteria bacterium]